MAQQRRANAQVIHTVPVITKVRRAVARVFTALSPKTRLLNSQALDKNYGAMHPGAFGNLFDGTHIVDHQPSDFLNNHVSGAHYATANVPGGIVVKPSKNGRNSASHGRPTAAVVATHTVSLRGGVHRIIT